MDILLIDTTGLVENVVEMASLAIAQAAFPTLACMQRTGAVGPGYVTHDGGLTFTAPAPAAKPTRLSKLDFVQRFTDAEYVGILTAAASSMALTAWMKKFEMATPTTDGTSIDLTDPRTIGGVHSLETSGLIAVGRAAQILTP